MRCFCGCGRKVGWRLRPVSKRGATIHADLAGVRTMLAKGLRSPNAKRFAREGDVVCTELAASVHEGVQLDPSAEETTRAFERFSQHNFTTTAVGIAARASGRPAREAAVALSRGTWDPFADVEPPTFPLKTAWGGRAPQPRPTSGS